MATKFLCKIEGCGKPVKSSGWCSMHAERVRKHGSPELGSFKPKGGCSVHGCCAPHYARGFCREHYVQWRNANNSSVCSIDGCGKLVILRGWCRGHYLRWLRHGDPLGGGRPLSEAGAPLEWAKRHIPHDSDECLIWPYGRTGSGYGALVEGGKRKLAHRWMCEAVNGQAPDGFEAAHSCGNGHLGCVNPMHLRWATRKENGEDKVLHGRSHRGEENLNAKLSQSAVLTIYSLRNSKRTCSEIGAEYGVHPATISGIWCGRGWSWLTGASYENMSRSGRRSMRMGGR